MDYEYLARLHKQLNDFYQTKIDALLSTKDFGQMREYQGAVSAVKSFREFIAEANNPQKKQENAIAENQYNV